jgi:hypothetical protein
MPPVFSCTQQTSRGLRLVEIFFVWIAYIRGEIISVFQKNQKLKQKEKLGVIVPSE